MKKIFLIAVIIGFLALPSIAHGQTNDSAKSKVDKLINDTYTNSVQEREYRAELIKRMDNTTCSNHFMGI